MRSHVNVTSYQCPGDPVRNPLMKYIYKHHSNVSGGSSFGSKRSHPLKTQSFTVSRSLNHSLVVKVTTLTVSEDKWSGTIFRPSRNNRQVDK